MLAYKKFAIFCGLIYLAALVFNSTKPSILEIKAPILMGLNQSSSKKPRIVIYGSSHCFNGLSASYISKITGMDTFNLCGQKMENENNIGEILRLLKPNDILIYAIRLPITSEDKGDSIFFIELGEKLDTLLPYLVNPINTEKFDLKGDKVDYKEIDFTPTDYVFTPKAVSKGLKLKIDRISKQISSLSKTPPRIIIVTAPILTKSSASLAHEIKISDISLPSNIITYIQPLFLSTENTFVDASHVNSVGRQLWTEQILTSILALTQK